jgi:hypothetical protein
MPGYGYVLDGIVTATGEVGISGSTVYLTLLSQARHSIRGGLETPAGFTGIEVFNFKFQMSRRASYRVPVNPLRRHSGNSAAPQE